MAKMVPMYKAELTKADAPIREAVTKVGGLPVFLAPEEWPACRECGNPLDFLAQFRLDAPLHLADRYAMAYVFMCGGDHGCETWVPGGGANAVILQADSDARLDGPGPAHLADFTATLSEGEEPLLTINHRRVSDALREEIELGTKLGGSPHWIQFPEWPKCPECGGPTRFIAQLDEFWGEGGLHNPDLAFGDAGCSYIFLCAAECSPRGAAFMWQCM